MSKENSVSDERYSDGSIAKAIEFLDGREYAIRFDAAGMMNLVGSTDVTSVDPSWLKVMLTELLSLRSKPVAGVEVKPLEWRVPTDRPDEMEDSALLIADGIGGHYAISHPQKVGPKFLLWWAHDPFHWAGFDTPEEAKSAAEADYRNRILSTLSLPAQEPIGWLSRGHGAVILFTVHAFMRDEWAGKGMEITPLYTSPQPEPVITEEMVAAAMREAWDEICSDTGCHPLDIEQLGRKRLQFTANHWARFTAMYLTAALKEA